MGSNEQATGPVTPERHGSSHGHRGVLVWRLPVGRYALSSAAVGGGATAPGWIVNIGVNADYGRTDLAAHVAEVAAMYGLAGPGIGLLTAVPVDRVARAVVEDVVADATVGVSKPVWAAGADEARSAGPGTINLVIQLPVALDGGAAVNAVMTATEAKTQALFEGGVDGTGTASDAVVVVWPDAGPPEPFAGPRSTWGARIARAVHEAVAAGLADQRRSGGQPPGLAAR